MYFCIQLTWWMWVMKHDFTDKLWNCCSNWTSWIIIHQYALPLTAPGIVLSLNTLYGADSVVLMSTVWVQYLYCSVSYLALPSSGLSCRLSDKGKKCLLKNKWKSFFKSEETNSASASFRPNLVLYKRNPMSRCGGQSHHTSPPLDRLVNSV